MHEVVEKIRGCVKRWSRLARTGGIGAPRLNESIRGRRASGRTDRGRWRLTWQKFLPILVSPSVPCNK